VDTRASGHFGTTVRGHAHPVSKCGWLVPSTVRRHDPSHQASLTPAVTVRAQRRFRRRRSLCLIFTPAVTVRAQGRFRRRWRTCLIFTPAVTVRAQRRFRRRRNLGLILTPSVTGASSVRRSHQTNCQSDPSNLHVAFPYLLKLTRTMRVRIITRVALQRSSEVAARARIKSPRASVDPSESDSLNTIGNFLPELGVLHIPVERRKGRGC